MRIRLVDRYIGRVALLGIAAVWVVMTALYVVFSLLSELRNGHADYGASDALWFVLLTIPRMAYQVFPVSALLGALVGVGGLAAANELVAFRTSGVSRSRLAVAALTGTLVLTVPVMIVGEWVAPAAEQQARAFRLSEMTGQAIIGGPRGMWMRDGSDIVNIQLPILSADRGQQSVEFKKVVIYRFDEGEGLTAVIRAENAIHDGDSWLLERIREVRFSDDRAVADLLTLADLAREEFETFFKRAVELKQKQKKGNATPLLTGLPFEMDSHGFVARRQISENSLLCSKRSTS